MMIQTAVQPIDLYLIIRTYPGRRVVGTAHSEAEAIKSVRLLQSCPHLPDAEYAHELNPKYPN